MRVVSWNVNGIRACVRHGFVDFVDRSGTSDIAADTLDPTLTMPSQMSPARAAVHWALPVVVAPLLFGAATHSPTGAASRGRPPSPKPRPR